MLMVLNVLNELRLFGTCRHCEIGALCLGLKRICSKMRSLFCILKMLNSLALFLLGLCNLVLCSCLMFRLKAILSKFLWFVLRLVSFPIRLLWCGVICKIHMCVLVWIQAQMQIVGLVIVRNFYRTPLLEICFRCLFYVCLLLVFLGRQRIDCMIRPCFF